MRVGEKRIQYCSSSGGGCEAVVSSGSSFVAIVERWGVLVNHGRSKTRTRPASSIRSEIDQKRAEGSERKVVATMDKEPQISQRKSSRHSGAVNGQPAAGSGSGSWDLSKQYKGKEKEMAIR